MRPRAISLEAIRRFKESPPPCVAEHGPLCQVCEMELADRIEEASEALGVSPPASETIGRLHVLLAEALRCMEDADSYVAARRKLLYADSLLDELSSSGVSPSGGWQPIDSAPKDSRVLLFNPYERELFHDSSQWAVRAGGWYEELGGWQYDGEGQAYSNAHPPTHWMPLPAPPASPSLPREGEKR